MVASNDITILSFPIPCFLIVTWSWYNVSKYCVRKIYTLRKWDLKLIIRMKPDSKSFVSSSYLVHLPGCYSVLMLFSSLLPKQSLRTCKRKKNSKNDKLCHVSWVFWSKLVNELRKICCGTSSLLSVFGLNWSKLWPCSRAMYLCAIYIFWTF